MRASAPVVRVGEERSDYCYFGLDVGSNEYFAFRDCAAHIEHLDPKNVAPVPNRNGTRGMLQCIVERKVARPRNPTDFPVRLPSFREWWDGTDEELYALMVLLVTSNHDVIEALKNMARAITTASIADRVIGDNRFPPSTHFVALHATETDASIETLCAYVNAHGGFARELCQRLEHADPLIQILTQRGQLERIRSAIEQIPEMFLWWHKYSDRPHVLEALRILTGVTN